jgi:hypothetical protein
MRTLQKSSIVLTTLLLTAAPLLSAPASQAATEAPPNPLVQGPPPTVDFILPPEVTGKATTQATTAGLARSGDVKVTLVTIQTADKSASETSAINLGATQNAVASANNYWKTMSNNRLTISIGNTITGFNTSARSDQNFDVIVETVTKEIGWVANPNSALVIFMPRNDVVVYGSGGNLGAGWSGGATTGRILMPYTSNLTNSVLAHEFGHVFGLMHANRLSCTDGSHDTAIVNGSIGNKNCTSREYGDTTDLMGASQTHQPFLNSVLYDYGSMGRGDEILDAGVAQGVKTYTLKAWAGTESKRAVKFTDPTSKETYYLQLKLPVGYDSTSAVNGNKGVEILKSDPRRGASMLIPPTTTPFSGYYDAKHAWQAGSTFNTSGGSAVTINSITSDSATVTVQGDVKYLLAAQFNEAAAANNLGTATSAIITGLKQDGAYQQFQNGFVIYSPASGAHVTRGGIRTAYQQAGFENGVLGYPTTDELGGLKDGGFYQMYQGGAIIWSPKTGAYISTGAIRDAWGKYGFENGRMGYPTSNPYPTINGGMTQDYQGGAIVWSPVSGAHISVGGIRTVWAEMGFEKSQLGYPTSDELTGLKDGGVYQMYQGGAIVWSPASGSYPSMGGIRTAWGAQGFENGKLGYPTSNEYASGNGSVTQNYQGGKITWSPATGTLVALN